MKRAAIYLRVSTDSQTTDNQEMALRDIAAKMGWDIEQVYADQGISGADWQMAMLRSVVARCFSQVKVDATSVGHAQGLGGIVHLITICWSIVVVDIMHGRAHHVMLIFHIRHKPSHREMYRDHHRSRLHLVSA